jgi:hypothetical protein
MKKILVYLGVLVATLLAILVIIAAFFEDRIGNKILTELNKSLKNDIETEGFDLSLIKGFPYASATLKKVLLPDALDGTAIFEAEELAFRFNMLSLFGSNIKVKSVLLKNGTVLVRYDKNGQPNYDVFKPTETSNKGGESGLSISLDNALLENVGIVYADERAKQYAKAMVNKADLSGNFGASHFVLASTADFKTEFVETGGERYFLGKPMGYDAKIKVDMKKGTYAFEQVNYQLGDNTFIVKGEMQADGEGTDYDLALDGDDCTLASVLDVLSEKEQSAIKDLKSKGKFKISGRIKGRSSKSQNPAINFQFGLEDGQIYGPQLADPLEDISFAGSFTNGKAHNNSGALLEIRDFKGYFNRQLIESELLVSDLDDPKIDFQLNGAIPLESVYALSGISNISDGSGEVEIHDLRVKGRYSDMATPSRANNADFSGKIVFDDAMLRINDRKMIFDRGELLLGNTMTVNGLRLVGANSDVTFEGRFGNVLPVLLADSLNSQKAELDFEAKLTAERIDLGELLAALSPVPEKGEVKEAVRDSMKTERIQQREHTTNFLKGTFDAHVKEFKYDKIKADDFIGQLRFNHNEMLLNGDTEAMGGHFKLDGKMFFEQMPRLNARIYCDKIDGREFFRQTDNFGQDVLTYNNIKGTLDAQIAVYAFWDAEGNFLYDKLNVMSDVTMTDGELNNFKMLEDFATYVKMRDLRNIRFTKTHNWFEVKDQKIYIPVMFIQSNALNLTLNGEHSFEQDIDYNVKVNAGQVVWNKLFKKAGEKPIKAKNGWFNLYYHIYGNMDKYDFKSDKQGVKEAFRKSEIHKFRIQKAMEAEFGKVYDLEEINETLDEGDKSSPPPAEPLPAAGPAPTKPTSNSSAYGEDEVIEGY